MKRLIQGTLVLATGVFIMLTAGCEEENAINPEIKKGRLMAAEASAENKQLKKEMEQLTKELNRQKELLAECLKDKKEKLAKCQQEKKVSEERQREAAIRQLNVAAEENSKLRLTIEKLKGHVKQLEEEIEFLKNAKKIKKWQEETEKTINDLSEIIVNDLERIAELQEENERLKTEIAELKNR